MPLSDRTKEMHPLVYARHQVWQALREICIAGHQRFAGIEEIALASGVKLTDCREALMEMVSEGFLDRKGEAYKPKWPGRKLGVK